MKGNTLIIWQANNLSRACLNHLKMCALDGWLFPRMLRRNARPPIQIASGLVARRGPRSGGGMLSDILLRQCEPTRSNRTSEFDLVCIRIPLGCVPISD